MRLSFLWGLALGAGSFFAPWAPCMAQVKLAPYNVVWNSQSSGPSGSMPIGNGDIGANVWVDSSGLLQLYISKTDAYSEIGRLLKIGKITIATTPAILNGATFTQTLDIEKGCIFITATNQQKQSITISIFADGQLLRNQIENGWLGIGGVILSDVAGSGGLRSTKIYGSMAYHQQLGNSSLLSAGFNVGWANKRIDATKLSFPDQFDEFGPIPNRVSDDPIQSARSFQYLSVNSGVSVFKKTAEREWYVGTSVRHINRPFSEETKNVNYRLTPTWGMQGGMKWILEQRMIDLYGVTNWKAGASEYLGGIRYSVLLGDSKILEKSTVIGVGSAVRFQDAIIPNLSLKFKQTQVALYYEIHVAGNNSSSFSRTGFELMISKQF